MRVVIRTRGPWPSPTIARARRRFEFALGRFAGRVRSLTVRVADLNGPRGGVDKQCRVAIRLDGSRRPIVIEDTNWNIDAAIDGAADRAARAVARALRSLRNHARPDAGLHSARPA